MSKEEGVRLTKLARARLEIPELREVISLRRMRGPGLERLKAARRVLIRSDNGFWRADAAGYTDASLAAEYTGSDAFARTRHCGPEKAVRYYVLKDRAALQTQEQRS